MAVVVAVIMTAAVRAVLAAVLVGARIADLKLIWR